MFSRLKKSKYPVIYPREKHNIAVSSIDPDAVKVMHRLNHYGHTAYLVGGSVRDLLLGRAPKDFDLSTSAYPNEIRKLFRNAFLIGRRFRLAHIKFQNNKIIETSTFRRQPEESECNDEKDICYHDSDNTFGTPEEDALRRDFTINALFYDIKTQTVIDHTGGLADLRQGIVRCIGDPNIRFREDPVRMMRAARFASRLDFSIEKKTWRAMKKHCHRISDATRPRLLEEIFRLFGFSTSERNFRLLYEAGILKTLMPDIHNYLNTPSAGQLWNHLAAFDRWSAGSGHPPEPALMMAALIYAPFLTALEKEEEKGYRIFHFDLVGKLFHAFAAEYNFPKKVYYRLIHIIDNQRRFIPSQRKFSRERFAAQETFHSSLDLWEIHLLATSGDPSSLQEWRNLCPERTIEEKPWKKRRSPARRRRRHP